MKKVKMIVRDPNGHWVPKESLVKGQIAIDIAIRKPEVDFALKQRTGLDNWPY